MWRGFFAHDRLRELRWTDRTGEVGPLRFDHAGVRRIAGPRTLAAFLRERGSGRPPPRVDFTRLEVYVVGVGPRSAAAYELRILRVEEQRSRVVVRIREATPSPGRAGRVGLRYPFRLITIPRTEKPVVLQWEGRP